jgi:hypothetical protein
MIKKLTLLSLMAMALAGFAASAAQGTSTLRWTDNGVVLAAGTNPTIHMAGTFKFSNATLGGTSCPVTAEVQLTGGSATAHVTEFIITNTAACVLNGALNTSCAKLTGHDFTGANAEGKANGKTLTTANGGAWVTTGTLNAGVASLDFLSE